MLDEFLTFINKQNLIQPTQKVLLTVSGGMDSVVMCDLFSKAKLDFVIAHCNFGLRGEESNEDEMFVKKLSIKYKVPFITTTFQTAEFAENEKISTQMAARVLRYEWFEKIRKEQNCDYIATAHHQNDVLETVLLNLTKGTGIAGLHGIKAKSGFIIRPMLFAEKESIFDYVVENQIIWREDSSNESNKYQRNLIRNEVVPLLKQINPNLENTIRQTVERVSAVEDIFEQEMEMLRKQITWSDAQATFVNYKAIQTLSQPVIKLAELLKPYNFTYQQCQDIFDAFDKEAGRSFLTPTHTLVKDRTELVITQKNLKPFESQTITTDDEILEINHLKLSFGKPFDKTEDFTVPTAKRTACLDAAKVRFPLQIRKWKEGDWFCPLGMNKKKLISDFLIDQKVPLNLKKDVYLLTSNGSVVWVIGMRIDDRFKVTDKTEKIVLFEVYK